MPRRPYRSGEPISVTSLTKGAPASTEKPEVEYEPVPPDRTVFQEFASLLTATAGEFDAAPVKSARTTPVDPTPDPEPDSEPDPSPIPTPKMFMEVAMDEVRGVDLTVVTPPVAVAPVAIPPVAIPPVAVAPAGGQPTAEQVRIKDLENQLALERGRKDPEPELEIPQQSGSMENIVIHFVDDGFTALGKVWYRGQELEFNPTGQAYQDTCDRTGRSWLELRRDEAGQIDRYGKVMFRVGPWPGKDLTDAATARFDALKPLKAEGGGPLNPSLAELEAAAKAEQKRKRAAPRLPVH